MLELEGFLKTGFTTGGGKTLLLVELALTNHGERSIVRDWELCVVKDNKPVFFQAAAIPDEGIILDNTIRVTKEKSLPEDAVRNPIEHGERRVGWVAFTSSQEIVDLFIKDHKHRLGSIRHKDYLAHKYSWDFEGTEENPYEYVPGETQ